MTEAKTIGARGAALALVVTGVLTVLLSFTTWGSCPTTPCGGMLMAISEYSGLDLGFGVVTALAGLGLAAIGLDGLRRKGVSRFATIAALLALLIVAAAGAWRATAAEQHGLEFVAVARSESASVLRHLMMAAYYHAGPPENRLGVGHTVPIGEGWVEGSPLDALLVSLPYLWGPKLEHCLLPDRHIQVLWLIPINEAERVYKQAHGADALEQRFEETSFDYLDPFRPSVVPEGGDGD